MTIENAELQIIFFLVGLFAGVVYAYVLTRMWLTRKEFKNVLCPKCKCTYEQYKKWL